MGTGQKANISQVILGWSVFDTFTIIKLVSRFLIVLNAGLAKKVAETMLQMLASVNKLSNLQLVRFFLYGSNPEKFFGVFFCRNVRKVLMLAFP